MNDALKELRDGRAGKLGEWAADEIEQLRFALTGLYEDQVDYLRLNNLGGYDNHWMRAARIALHRPADPNEMRAWLAVSASPTKDQP